MKPLDRAFWCIGILAIAAVVVYWPTIVTAWKNRANIAAASQIAQGVSQL